MSVTLLHRVLTEEPIHRAEASDFLRAYADGHVGSDVLAALLTALRVKGETPDLLAGFVDVLRERMIPVDAEGFDPVDLCGTGGDGQGTVNLSTAAAFVASAAGAVVAKHGNRGVSSLAGSSDVLVALGLPPLPSPDMASLALARHGLAFLHAPHHHPLMAQLAPLRKTLGFRTVFNLVGPLCNPAKVRRQVLGVSEPRVLEPLARALRELGTHRALVLCTPGPYDEVSLTGNTRALWVERERIQVLEFGPSTFGVEPVVGEVLRGGTPQDNATRLEGLFQDPDRDADLARVVAANAACALWVADRATDLREGFELARRALRDGRAYARLQELRNFHREVIHGLAG